jgi:hypothetical protein
LKGLRNDLKKELLIFINSILLVLLISVTALYIVKTNQDIPSAGTQFRESMITIEDIKKNYNNREIVNITNYLNYVLVESSINTTGGSMYELWNLKNGDSDILPVGPIYACLYKMINPNKIVFAADGRSTIGDYKRFPFYIECLRNKEYPSERSDFYKEEIPQYVEIDEPEEFGPKHKEASVSSNTVLGKYAIEGVNVHSMALKF